MSNRKKRSIIWSLNKYEFQNIVEINKTLADILRFFGLHVGAGNYKTLKRRIQEENINIDHIPLGRNHNNGRIFGPLPRIPLEQILIKNSTYNHGAHIKKRLFDANLLQNKCYICGQLPIWNNEPLVLQLDHINGIHNDNRIENLRILCPHCHTQTTTFNGRNNKYKCVDCNIKIRKTSIRCETCDSKNQLGKNTKIKWPSIDELLSMLNSSNFTQIAKKLGVSDNAIRGHLKRHALKIS